jgi:hypothetical protein
MRKIQTNKQANFVKIQINIALKMRKSQTNNNTTPQE